MAHGRDKHRSRENRARVREVLMREWDPIGVAYVPDTSDEYDAYVGKVYVMLMDDGADAAAIAAYLEDIATNYMGITANPALTNDCSRAAAILLRLKPSFGLHCA